jgi:hypothetical protein
VPPRAEAPLVVLRRLVAGVKRRPAAALCAPGRRRPKPPPAAQWEGKPRVRVLSLGGGLDSFAMLLVQIAAGEPPDLVIFADVTDPEQRDPGEWPGTYRHVSEVVMPLCAAHGIEFEWLDTRRSPIRGRRSLYRYFKHKRIMPGRTSRLCTAAAKVERITDRLIERYPDRPIEVWIGFEAGEEERAKRDPHAAGVVGLGGWRVNRFPLVERRLYRCRCELLVRVSGHPVPRKSACMICGFNTRGDFQTLERELPDVFDLAADLEEDCRPTKGGKILRYGYRRGDGTDPPLRLWIAKPYQAAVIPCPVCGRLRRASKATGCDYLPEELAVW